MMKKAMLGALLLVVALLLDDARLRRDGARFRADNADLQKELYAERSLAVRKIGNLINQKLAVTKNQCAISLISPCGFATFWGNTNSEVMKTVCQIALREQPTEEVVNHQMSKEVFLSYFEEEKNADAH